MANEYTPQQLEEILRMFFDVAGTRQYIGARYVPLFGRRGESSIVWDNTAPYEPLTIVTYQGNSYTSRTYVPTGIDISNETYWALTGNYNAQVEQYREEVVQLQESWVDWKTDTIGDLDDWKTDTLGDLDDWKTDTLGDIDDEIDTKLLVLPTSKFSSSNTVFNTIMHTHAKINGVLFGDSWVDGGGSTIAAEFTRNGHTLTTYGESGVTFAQLITQVQNAIANTTLEFREKITHVLILAGLNTASLTDDYVENDNRAPLEAIKAGYPNAQIHWFPNGAWSGVPKPFRYCQIRATCFYEGVSVHMDSMDCLRAGTNSIYYGGDTLFGLRHPSTLGYQFLARQMMTLLYGGDVNGARVITKLYDSNNNYIEVFVTKNKGVVTLQGLPDSAHQMTIPANSNSVEFTVYNGLESSETREAFFATGPINLFTNLWVYGDSNYNFSTVPMQIGTGTGTNETTANSPLAFTVFRPHGIPATNPISMQARFHATYLDPIWYW